jgi:hypothetical protein
MLWKSKAQQILLCGQLNISDEWFWPHIIAGPGTLSTLGAQNGGAELGVRGCAFVSISWASCRDLAM